MDLKNLLFFCSIVAYTCHCSEEKEAEGGKNLREAGETSLPLGFFRTFKDFDYSPIVETNLDLSAYMGRWYEVASSLTAKLTFMLGCTCATADYALQDENSFVSVYNSCLRFGKRSDFYADAFPVSPTHIIDNNVFIEEAKLQLEPRIENKELLLFNSAEGNYWILYADSDLAIVGGPSVWTSPLFFLSRSPEFTSEQFEILKNLAIAAGIPAIRTMTPFLTLSSQENCEYPPQP